MDIMSHLQPNKPNFAKWILVYYWGLIGILNFDLPLFISQTNISRLTIFALGYLFCHMTTNNDKLIEQYESYIEYLNSQVKGPKLITSWGVYSWTGEAYNRLVNGITYLVFHEGINFMGERQRFDKVFICPKDQVVGIGPHMLIKSDIKLTEHDELPAELLSDVEDAWVLKGNVPAPFFGDVDKETIQLQRELDTQMAYSCKLAETNKELGKCLSDAYMLIKSGQPVDKDKSEFKDFVSLVKSNLPAGVVS